MTSKQAVDILDRAGQRLLGSGEVSNADLEACEKIIIPAIDNITQEIKAEADRLWSKGMLLPMVR